MKPLVIGIGNPDRGDDAVGPRVVEHLRASSPADLELRTVRGDMLALFDCWADARTVVLVDAMQSGAPSGTVKRIDASAGEVGAELGSFVSTHAFSLAEAIALARSLGRLPERLLVYGVEAVNLEPAAPLSAAVERAVPAVAEAILEEARCTKLR